MPLADQGMKVGLRALNGFARLELLDRLGLREPAERIIYGATKRTVRTAGTVGRAFNGATAGRRDPAQLAAERMRPAAQEADKECAAPAELLKESSELGITIIGVPEELGGVFAERSSTSAVLVAEMLAQGDMGLAFAALAPGAVSTAIS